MKDMGVAVKPKLILPWVTWTLQNTWFKVV